eukprot:130220-Prorocentrum_lima.AAC.1
MTSSLVGSEMCIRDSIASVRVGVPPPAAGSGQQLAVESGSLTPNTLEAVSYTHLTLPTICSV